MPSGITLATGVLIGSPTALDAKYGPYDTVALALADLTSGFRYQGLTVGIKSGSSIVEYWFKDGVENANFVEKGTGSSGTLPAHTHQISEVTGLQTQLDVRPTLTVQESVTIPQSTNELFLDDITPLNNATTRFFQLMLNGSNATAQLTIIVGNNLNNTTYGKTTLRRVLAVSASGGTRRPYRLVRRNFINLTAFTDQELVAYPAANFPSSNTVTVTLSNNTGMWELGSVAISEVRDLQAALNQKASLGAVVDFQKVSVVPSASPSLPEQQSDLWAPYAAFNEININGTGIADDGSGNTTVYGPLAFTAPAAIRTALDAAPTAHTHPSATVSSGGFMASTDKQKLDAVFSVPKTNTIYIRRFASFTNSGFTGDTSNLGSLTNAQLNARGYFILPDEFFEMDPLWLSLPSTFTLTLFVETGGITFDGIRVHLRRRNIATNAVTPFGGTLNSFQIPSSSSNSVLTVSSTATAAAWGGQTARERIEIWFAAYSGGNGGFVNNFIFKLT